MYISKLINGNFFFWTAALYWCRIAVNVSWFIDPMTFQNCLFLGKLIQVPPDAVLKKRQRDFVSWSEVIWGLLINEKQFYMCKNSVAHIQCLEKCNFLTGKLNFSFQFMDFVWYFALLSRTNPLILCYFISFVEVNIIQAKCFSILPFNKGWKCWNFGKENSEQGKFKSFELIIYCSRV